MFRDDYTPSQTDRARINQAYRMDEQRCVNDLLASAQFTAQEEQTIAARATELVKGIRARRKRQGGLDAFMTQYDLSSEEGIALMCLAEAMLRIPDKTTVDMLIKDKLGQGEWQAHQGKSDSLFVNATTWGLMLTGRLFSSNQDGQQSLAQVLKTLIAKSGMPAVRLAVNQMMKIMSRQFVMEQTIEKAIKRARAIEKQGYRYSYDMLGEAARTEEDAARYFDAYLHALTMLGTKATQRNLHDNPGLSVKLSALYPRYIPTHRQQAEHALIPKLLKLAQLAKQYNLSLTVDAEEAECLDMSLSIIEAVYLDPSLKGWAGLGLAVQAYQKRAYYVLQWLIELAKRGGRQLMVRLVKGAYWDTEIKLAQVEGLDAYPVFTRKAATDVSYIACAKLLAANLEHIYPQFATHNAYTVAAIQTIMGQQQAFEFQCLHGMGDSLYDQPMQQKPRQIACRIYAPVGGYEDLLAYLVRRLLENGANSSFVNRITDESLPIAELIQSPMQRTRAVNAEPHPKIPLPKALYGASRCNSQGVDVSDHEALMQLEAEVTQAWQGIETQYAAQAADNLLMSYTPTNLQQGYAVVANLDEMAIESALQAAHAASHQWRRVEVETRAAYLDQMADSLQERLAHFIALLRHEAGKTLHDAVSEVREAIDFCRYYADQARTRLQVQDLPGPTGEHNALYMQGRGVVLCISPWNFPLAIFLGQVTAALAAGNTVLAKPASQTLMIAKEAIALLHAIGIPEDVVQLLPCRGSVVGKTLIPDARIAAVMFTGSTETAWTINQGLAARTGPIVPFIAETGGQNAMIVDSSALPEQVVDDVVLSAFGSAGQRCSALRVLYVQEDIADKLITMLKGAMACIRVDDPRFIDTDVGPVIDQAAKNELQAHVDKMQQTAELIYQVPLSHACDAGSYFAPCAFLIDSIKQLTQETFGPVLHVVRYKASELGQVIDDINQAGFGLTFGVQSRISTTIDFICQRIAAGNIYINRNMIGAVVGVQPFGGQGLSGTGPKAGGPHYLPRLCIERTVTVDTTAAGGNASLMSLSETG